MTKKNLISIGAGSLVWLMCASALAAINRPTVAEQGNTYEECTLACSAFADAKGCREFRRARLICSEKKKSTWPIFTAQVLQELE